MAAKLYSFGSIWPERMAPWLFGLAVLAAGADPLAAFEESVVKPVRPSMQNLGSSSLESAAGSAVQTGRPAQAAFQAEGRSVSNWQSEALGNLDLPPATEARLASGADPAGIPRCVKLNNYWCIKRARWAGEIAADSEGHVAFASALDGAVAAALLLRRYYLDYNRRSALAILSRWAPEQCAGPAAGSARLHSPRASRFASLAAIAPLGIRNTLRARWLAANRPVSAGQGKKAILRRSFAASRPLAMMPAPEIAVGMGEAGRAPVFEATKFAALEFPVPVAGRQLGGCGGESMRIHTYALAAIAGIALSPAEDLRLFPTKQTPGTNLRQLLANMAKVEIGPLAPRPGLIAAAVARLAPQCPAFEPASPANGPSSDETTSCDK